MGLAKSLTGAAWNIVANVDTFREAARIRNPRVLTTLLGPALRGFVRQQARGAQATDVPVGGEARFDWTYKRDHAELGKLYGAAVRSQWDASQLAWQTPVDIERPHEALLPERWNPLVDLPQWARLTDAQKAEQTRSYMSWVLSQFLHGEQGAFYAAAQVGQAVPWMDGKLFGATQVVDEARHVEVFHRYLSEKLERVYSIDDNLYVIIDALMGDRRFDIKFLGMQIMIEGLALGAFSTYRSLTREPLLRELLKNVITDEARHVRFGVLALREYVATLPANERREREDWAFELSLLMRNRFLLHEFYEEYYAHSMSRRDWDQYVLSAPMMDFFRKTMFERIVPNLRRIGLLSDRVRPYYAELGLLEYETGRAATELTAEDLLEVKERPPPAPASAGAGKGESATL